MNENDGGKKVTEQAKGSLLASGTRPENEENLGGSRISLADLGLRPSSTEQYREHIAAMEARHGYRWRETFAEMNEAEKKIAELECENAKLRSILARHLPVLETDQHWEN